MQLLAINIKILHALAILLVKPTGPRNADAV
jgi:hypothetical protein